MLETLRLEAKAAADVERAALILRRGGLVAFPTETVYGLGANALSAEAVHGIFVAKRRPSWDPLIVHLAALEQLPVLTEISPDLAQRVALLTRAFWPGPLTLLLPRRPVCPVEVTAGRDLVGVRMPAHPVAQQLLRAAGLPVAAPSANLFGHVSPTTAAHVLDDLDGRIDAVLDGGAAAVGVESTVVDPAPTPMVVYRAGAVTIQALQEASGVAAIFFKAAFSGMEAEREALPSPGVGLRHYAPAVPLQLVGPSIGELLQEADRAAARGEKACVVLPTDWQVPPGMAAQIVPWGCWSNPANLAAELFDTLRRSEITGATVVLCPLPQPGGLRDAIRDRLLKASLHI